MRHVAQGARVRGCALLRAGLALALLAGMAVAQQPVDASALPQEPATPGTVNGVITDTDHAAIPGAKITLENLGARVLRSVETDTTGVYEFQGVPPGKYLVKIVARGFSPWKVEDVDVAAGQSVTLTTVELGVEALSATVDAITVEDQAEQQITAEEHQRILGILPNFFVSYEPHAMPLTKRQKFKLALVVSRDPLTFFTTGVTAGIEQWQDDFSGYGANSIGYLKRYGATYGDRVDATFLGAAVLPSLLHQDPRYFYNGKGTVVHRALYAIMTTVVCKGDNGKWQPNYSNVFGNLGAAGISTLYYPDSDKHSVQVTVDNTLIGVAYGAFGTLFQEFLLKHVTHGIPKSGGGPGPSADE